MLHYQPIVDLAHRRDRRGRGAGPLGAPAAGLVCARQFIPLAEETGLIVPIGRRVLTTALAAQVAQWRREPRAPRAVRQP